MIVITAFIAVRLLQLRELVSTKNAAKDINCQEFFSPLEWKLLWAKTEKKVLPKELPSLHWAYYALAKLGRWHDSKRNGVVGWNALWDGWQILTQLVDGARLVHQQLSLDEM
ncbi:IS4 family transposase [Aliivibrio salmonicida]